MNTGYIYSISISPSRGQLKQEVLEANIMDNYGIEGDGHAGDRAAKSLVSSAKRRHILLCYPWGQSVRKGFLEYFPKISFINSEEAFPPLPCAILIFIFILISYHQCL